ncbi:MAG: hypothetical protein HZA91_10130 [Verrucomicrobia bacterium]|nr:hypothetical protein [Verrucomicrobiota bacterium]
MNIASLSVRVNRTNPDHHLWNNNGTWFVHYTVYPDRLTKERVRRSLGTKSLAEARRKRDVLFRNWGGASRRVALAC